MNRCVPVSTCAALLALAAGLGADVADNHTNVQANDKKVVALEGNNPVINQGEGGVAGGIGVVCAETGTPAHCDLPDQTSARTSDVQALFKVAERFSNTSGGPVVVTKLCWWGIYIDFAAAPDVDCSDDPATTVDAFTVTFFNNDATAGCPNSVPGAVKAGPFSQPALVVAKAPTGLSNGSFLEFEYSITIPGGGFGVANNECVWVQIQNDSTGTVSPNCVWLWETTPGGDGFALQDTNSDGDYTDPGDQITDDLAMCVDKDLGATAGCNFVINAGCVAAAGECNAPHVNPGCNDPCCCSAVCAILPLCCITEWSLDCADTAIVNGCATPPYECTAPAYANDCCTSPMVVTDGANIAFNTAGANSDGAPEGIAGDCIPNGTVEADLWYKFVAAEPGTLEVSTCNSANYDTTLEIYDVGNGTYDCQDIKDQIGLVGCNDDGGPVADAPCATNTSHVMAVTTSLLTAPKTYLIRLGGFDGTTGSGTIKFNYTPGIDLVNTGVAEATIFNGTANTLVGLSSGNLTPDQALPQRRTAQPFTVPALGNRWQITQIWADGFKPAAAPTAVVNTSIVFEIFNRVALNTPPGPADLVATQTLPYPVAYEEPEVGLADPNVRHLIDATPFSLAPGNYWLTIYATNATPGVNVANFAWFTNAPGGLNNACPLLVNPGGCFGNAGCTGQPALTPVAWRSCTYPAPGFQGYQTAAIAIDVVNDPTPDPADLFNTAFRVRGRPCVWDCGNQDGQTAIVDFLAVLAQWGQVGTPCDVDGGGVSITDFLALLAHWGPC